MPTVDFVTLTVRTLALCAILNPAFVLGPNSTSFSAGLVLRINMSVPPLIIFVVKELNPRIPLLRGR